MENQTPQSETIPSEIFKETLKNELNFIKIVVKFYKCFVFLTWVGNKVPKNPKKVAWAYESL